MKRNNSKLIVPTLLRDQLSRALRTEKVHHEVDEEADGEVDVGVGAAEVEEAVVGEVEVAMARKANLPQYLRNRAEKSANGPSNLTAAQILVFVVRLSPRLRHPKKQKRMLHCSNIWVSCCELCVQLYFGAFRLER
jgi:hypothetical protein